MCPLRVCVLSCKIKKLDEAHSFAQSASAPMLVLEIQ